MRPQPIRFLLIATLLSLPLFAQGTFLLERATNATLGGNLQFVFSGLPQPLLVLASSDAAGTTPLPPAISNHPLDIGPNLTLFVEVASGSTGATAPIAIPNSLALAGLLNHWQAASLPGATTLVDALSPRVVTHITQPQIPTLLPTTATGKAWAARIRRADPAGGPGTWLFAGGATRLTIEQLPLATTDVFDPQTLEVHPGPLLPDDVYAMTATELLDGSTLLTGGVTQLPVPQVPPPQDATNGAVLYDPVANVFLPMPPMSVPRFLHSAARLTDGRVVVVGGTASANFSTLIPLASCEIFDPVTRTWSAGPSLPTPWLWGALSALPNGELLLHGGLAVTPFGLLPSVVSQRLVAGPSGTLSWQLAAGMANPRVAHERNTLQLADGRLLVAGGCVATIYGGVPLLVSTNEVDTYDPTTGTWTQHAVAPAPFYSGTLDQMPNGIVVATGGLQGFLGNGPFPVQPLAVVQTWDPSTGQWQPLTPMQQPRLIHGAVVGSDGVLTVLGGQVIPGAGPGNFTVERLVP